MMFHPDIFISIHVLHVSYQNSVYIELWQDDLIELEIYTKLEGNFRKE